jgi:hypothetical protein
MTGPIWPIHLLRTDREKPVSSLRMASVFKGMTRMNLFNILLAESSGQPCSDDRSHNLKSILEKSALGSHLRLHRVWLDRLDTVPSEPDLVVFRFGPQPLLAWKNLIERLQGGRPRSSSVPYVATRAPGILSSPLSGVESKGWLIRRDTAASKTLYYIKPNALEEIREALLE